MTLPVFRRNLFLASPSLRGEDVRSLQRGLAGQGFRLEQDGIFGLETRAAVVAFQARHALVQDGIAGAATWAALFGNGATPPSADAARHCFDVLTAKHWTAQQACGIVANIEHESRFNPDQYGDGFKAYGLAQWHPDRQDQFRQFKGRPIQGSSMEDQLDFIDWEMRKGRETSAGKRLMAATTAREAGEIVSRYYERPAAADAQAKLRDNCAEGYYARFRGEGSNQPPVGDAGPVLSGPARTASDILSTEHIGDLLRPHRVFRDSKKWLLSPDGVEFEGTPLLADTVAEQRIRQVLDAYQPMLLSVLGNGQVPIELVLAAIAAVYDLKDTRQNYAGADKDFPERTPDRVCCGLMQTRLSVARLITGRPALSVADMINPETAVRAGAGSMWLHAAETGYDPPLAAAVYNVGDLRRDVRSRWGLLQYRVGTKDYIDEFVRYFNAAMKVTGHLQLPSGVATFHRWLDEARPAASRSGAGYVADDPLAWVGRLPVDSGQCVALVQRAAGAPQTRLWRRGERVQGKQDIATGTAIATFDADGAYGNHTDGRSHAALYVSQDESGIMVVDQWINQPPQERKLRFNNTSATPVNRGEEFFIIA